jgi:putative MFS transporter
MAGTEIAPSAGGLDLESGMSPRKWQMVWMSVGGVLLDGYDITIISVALLILGPQFKATPADVGLIGAATLAGNTVGAIIFGHLADRVGRKYTFYWDIMFFVVFAFVSAFSQNIGQLILWRFLLGIGIGADYALASPIIAEVIPTKNRGRILTANWALAWLIGELLAFVIGYALIPIGPNSWRWMLAIGAVPAIIVLVARRSFVESPRWLRSSGRTEEANDILRQLHGDAVPASPARPSETQRKPVHHYRELFSPKYARATIFAFVNYFVFSLAFYMAGVFLPSILSLGGFAKDPEGIALGNLAVQSVGILGIIVCFLFIESLGRRLLNIIGFVGMAAGILIYLLTPNPSGLIMLVGFALFEFMVFVGPGIMDNLYLGELWPTRIRTTGAGIGAAGGRISSMLGVFFLPLAAHAWGVKGMLLIPLAACIIGALNSLFLGIETKQRSLEEMWGE